MPYPLVLTSFLPTWPDFSSTIKYPSAGFVSGIPSNLAAVQRFASENSSGVPETARAIAGQAMESSNWTMRRLVFVFDFSETCNRRHSGPAPLEYRRSLRLDLYAIEVNGCSGTVGVGRLAEDGDFHLVLAAGRKRLAVDTDAP